MNTTAMNPTSPLSGSNPVAAAAERAHHVVDRAAEKAVPALERASGAAHRTIDKAVDVAMPAADWVADSGKQLATRSTEIADACSGYVRARPLVSVAGALVLGYFVGKLMR